MDHARPAKSSPINPPTIVLMPDRPGVAPVPPLPDEDHVCADCGLAYRDLELQAAVDLITRVPSQVRLAIGATPENLRRRPAAGVWSVAEYICHLRDVYVTTTIRLYRARTEERPVLEPMLNDLRAQRFRYNDASIEAVLDELDAAVHGCVEEVGQFQPSDWERVVTRLPGEQRTARWLVRQAAHEGRHHLGDITMIGSGSTKR
jgi:hypothetical protein